MHGSDTNTLLLDGNQIRWKFYCICFLFFFLDGFGNRCFCVFTCLFCHEPAPTFPCFRDLPCCWYKGCKSLHCFRFPVTNMVNSYNCSYWWILAMLHFTWHVTFTERGARDTSSFIHSFFLLPPSKISSLVSSVWEQQLTVIELSSLEASVIRPIIQSTVVYANQAPLWEHTVGRETVYVPQLISTQCHQ